jgi:hypothetical protein
LGFPKHDSFESGEENNMNKFIASAVVALAGIAVSQAQINIDVYASPAPNFFGSGSWGSYLNNALVGIENGGATTGASGPSQYFNTNGQTWGVENNLVTNFDSWMGTASAASPFDNQLGTRWHFGVRVVSAGTRFALQNLTYSMTSLEQPTLNTSGNFVGANFSTTRFGIDYVDGIKGNGNDITYTSGNGTTFVDEIIYVGIGNAFAVLSSDPGATNQDKLDLVANSLAGYTLTTTYGIDFGAGNVATGSAFTNFEAVPEPATMTLLGLAAAVVARKKRKA